MPSETRESLIQKRGTTKRRITNLVKKIEQLVQKAEPSAFDIVCADQYLSEMRELDAPFQQQHLEANVLVDPANQEAIERDFEEVENHDDRVRENVSKLLFFLSTSKSNPQGAKSTDSKGKKSLEVKWNRITGNVINLTEKINIAQENLDESEIEDLTDIRNELSECEKGLDRFTTEVNSISADFEDPDGDKWNDAISRFFDKVKTAQDTLNQLITQRRRDQNRQNIEREIMREQNRSKELEQQNIQHREELSKLLQELKSPLDQGETKTVKLPSLNIPTFDGEPTNWKSYWQQFEATIHNSKKLDDQLRMQYLLKSLVTKKAKDVIQGIDDVGEACPEAIAALKARFDRPQVIHRAHVRALRNVKPLKDGSSAELRQLHDTFQHHLRSMKALGQLDFERFITALGESKLDPVTMVEWQKFTQKEKEVPDYHKLLEFLDLRSTATELTTHHVDHKKPQASYSKFKTNPSGSVPRPVSVYATSAQTRCPACGSSRHGLAYCRNFKERTLTDRRDFVLVQGLCFNCLKPKHIGKHCPSPNSCLKCNKRHHTLIHADNVNMERAPEVPKQTTPSAVPRSNNAENGEMTSDVATVATSMTYVTAPEVVASGSVVMMTAEVVLSGPSGHQMIGRALLDPASTASFITERAAQHLKLRREKQEISVSGIGGTQCPTQSHAVVNVNLKSVRNSMSLHSVQAIVLSSLTKHLPITSLPKGDWPHLSALKLADPEFNVSKPVDVLLGVDVYQSILKPGLILGPKGTPAAQNTIFGWVLFGNVSNRQSTSEVTTLHISTFIPSCEEILQKFWTLEEPPKAKFPLSPLEKLVVQDFEEHRSFYCEAPV